MRRQSPKGGAARPISERGLILKKIHTATIAAILAFAACGAQAQVGTSPALPASLAVPATQVLSLETRAVGVQIYVCAASKGDATHYDWVFKAPEAELFNLAGIKIGKHYAGPTWEADDGSKVVGEVKAHDNGPDASAIPWLLLSAKSNAGEGLFGKTTSVQRVNTSGGKALPDGCDKERLGKESRVPYKAAYYFYSA
ncbi:MAG TPA: hypothetical protein DCW29_07925, partial [Janthinobacterium sp.]|nr:hypothetical protein [Janthinobacterium sp.]